MKKIITIKIGATFRYKLFGFNKLNLNSLVNIKC